MKGKQGKRMIILEKGEKAESLWGMGIEYITDEEIEALKSGRKLWLLVNDEYAVVIKYMGGDKE